MHSSVMAGRLAILPLLLIVLLSITDMISGDPVCHEAKGVKFTTKVFWKTKMCLHFSTKRLPYLQAKWSCTSLKSHLVVVDTKEKLQIIIDNAKNANMWIGMESRHGSFYWANEVELSNEARKTLFAPGEPNAGRDEDCVHYWYAKKALSNGKCGSELVYVCQK